MGGKTKTTTQTTSSQSPWGPQADQLKYAFGEARSIYDQQSGTPGYQGAFSAGLNTTQTDGLEALRANGVGTRQFGGTLATTGEGLLPNLVQAGEGYGAMAGGDPRAMALYDRALADPTQDIIRAGGQYAANPYLDAQIEAANRDTVRGLTEQTLPGINTAATGLGSLNSSRAGMAEGIAIRGAQDRMADVSATMRGQAYDRGLNLASQNYQQGMSNALNANNQNMATAQAGLAGLTNTGTLGAQIGQQGYGLGQSGAAQQLQAGSVYQEEENRVLQDAQRRVAYDENRPWQQLANLYGVVGSQNWGSEGQSTQVNTTPRPSALQTALGVGLTIGGAALGGPAGAAAGKAIGGMFSGGGGALAGAGGTGAAAGYPLINNIV